MLSCGYSFGELVRQAVLVPLRGSKLARAATEKSKVAAQSASPSRHSRRQSLPYGNAKSEQFGKPLTLDDSLTLR
ncbi:hypothetical protein [Dendronalium sp. ChiSLP03b]|uniref:hypothetical protein n=1 Tax=Dendronalium sp. ChiSLP03b TaxID=3075381 RepID=UPI002AD70DFF|nr:hypothetical protein [Dendronalium sp. ChiSLP03b]